MWVPMFHYEMAIAQDTLFIKGRLENDLSRVAFSMPVGALPLRRSVALLRAYCHSQGIALRFSAIPETSLSRFMSLTPKSLSLLKDWGDYLYDIESIATLRGKKMAKKRNHVHQFIAKYGPDCYSRITETDVPDLLRFMDAIDSEADSGDSAVSERMLTRKMLRSMFSTSNPMEGGLLRSQEGEILAFTFGDIKGDTLCVHVEKALREAPGAFEMIASAFAQDMLSSHPHLRYANREDDCGDPGLQKAKLSWHPASILRKYNITF